MRQRNSTANFWRFIKFYDKSLNFDKLAGLTSTMCKSKILFFTRSVHLRRVALRCEAVPSTEQRVFGEVKEGKDSNCN